MKKFIIFLVFSVFSFIVSAQRPFITTWETTTVNERIRIPTILTIGTYNYNVDWGDGNITTGVIGDATHSYVTPGIYVVRITGDFPAIFFNNSGDKDKILTIEQWGDIEWEEMTHAFYGCSKLDITNSFIDTPDLRNVNSMEGVFREATSFNGYLPGWRIPDGLKSLSSMFEGAASFNRNINDWDFGQVDDCSSMFKNAISFNQPLDGWSSNIGGVENLSSMFEGAISFNQNIDNWFVTIAKDVSSMFKNATSFNQPLNSWSVVGFRDTTSMFEGAVNFNQDLSSWRLSLVQDTSSMFKNATSFNGDISSLINTSLINSFENAISMFEGAINFNQDISTWDTSNVTNISNMFNGAVAFDQNLEDWDVSEVADATGMFDGVTLSTSNYDALLIGWNSQSLETGVVFSGGNSKYCLGEAARENMIVSDLWGITDGGSVKPTVDMLSDVSECISYTLPNLSTGNSYYTGSGGTGTLLNAGDVITSSQTIYIYTGTASCNNESSFTVTLSGLPSVDRLSDVSECSSYTLPNLSTGNSYYTGSGGTGTLLNAGDVITSSQTIYIYTGTASCNNESSFMVTLSGLPSVDSLSDISACSSYTLPILSSGNFYYTGSGGTGTLLNAGDVITSSQTIYIYTGTASCNNESSFTVTLSGLPSVDSLSDVSECSSYTLPTLRTGNSYYTGSGGTGTLLNAGDVITSSQMIYIYTGTASCNNESSFTVTLSGLPSVDSLSDVSECSSYTLPTLSSGNFYYTGSGGTGTLLNAGDVITSSQTIYIYTGTASCNNESSFTVTLSGLPSVDSLSDVSECSNYTLPILSTGNFYYTGSGGTGTLLNAGDVITSSQTIYIYTGTASCNNESSFTVMLSGLPSVDSLSDVSACSSYTLPTLSSGNFYYTGRGGTGTLLNAGDVITSSQTIYIYTGTASCNNETSFTVTLSGLLSVDSLSDVSACGSYTLPTLSSGNFYYTGS
uniref:BspA family leucine-rich repeat surface protein n=1 Tax=Tenacibaculum agarivorans TaxID=1908389 RepID=UPI000A7E9EA8